MAARIRGKQYAKAGAESGQVSSSSPSSIISPMETVVLCSFNNVAAKLFFNSCLLQEQVVLLIKLGSEGFSVLFVCSAVLT